MQKIMKYPEIVTKVKKLWQVGGEPFIKEGQFTDEQIDHQVINKMECVSIGTEDKLNLQVNEFINLGLPIKAANQFLMQKMNWQFPHNENFWQNSGSVSFKKEGFRNEKVPKDALGWFDVFEQEIHERFQPQPGMLRTFKAMLNSQIELNKLKNTLVSQESYMFSDGKEYAVAVERAKEAIIEDALKFARDPEKPINERIAAFNIGGTEAGFIHEPTHPGLRKIFNIMSEQDWYQRHQSVRCDEILEWWMEEINQGRLEIDYTQNKYHPTLRKTQRNYEPSQEAIERLHTYYFNNLVIEGVSSFIFDW